MNWNQVMGLISTIALSLPILMILATGLATYRTFPVLLIYYVVVAGYNLLTEGYITASGDFIYYYGIANNLLDAPLMLTFLTYFCTSPALKKRMHIFTLGFILFEIIIVSIYGFSVKTITIIMGPGIIAVLAFCIPSFVRHTKITIMHHKAAGKSMITASLLFAYGCYSIIYLMYYLLDIHDESNTFLVYFFVTTFSALLMTAGIISENTRVKKLSELKVVRKELSALYSDEKTAPPLRSAVFDYDKDQWN